MRIDAITVDAAGAFVTTLAAGDFELTEGGTPQTIEEVRLVASRASSASTSAPADGDLPPVTSAADERREAARPGARLVAIYLDEYHVSPGVSTDRARAAVTAFLDRHVGSRDLIVVMKPLDSLFSIRLTHDIERARQIVAGFEGRKGDYTPRAAYERSFMAGTPERIETARTQVSVSAINALAVHLGSLGEMRKSLLVVSEGLARAPRQRGREYLSTIDSTLSAANRARVSIYPIDPRGPEADPAAAEDERAVLRALAEDTSGRFADGSGDLGAALDAMTADLGAYYLVGYRANHVEDGRFHEVVVRVKRPGVTVRARSGYWSPSFDDRLRAEVVARAANPPPPPPVEPARRFSQMIRPWFGFSLGPDGRTRVTFVWEPVAPRAGDRSRRGPPVRLLLTALTADNAVLFSGPVLPSGPGGIDDVQAKTWAAFDAAPGRLKLRMSIEDATAAVVDTDVRDVAVRDLRRGVTIGTPALFRVRTAREFQTLDADANAVPVASRDFSRTERLQLRVPAYAAAGEPPVLSARLLNRTGQAMRTLEVRSADAGLGRVDLALASLATGEYFIEIAARARTGEAKERISFQVTN